MSLRTITIDDGHAQVVIVPALGGGLARYDWRGSGGFVPVFRRCEDPVGAGPFDLACNLLVPWSNRISGGGFSFQGHFHPLEPNLPGEPFPIHGNGFQQHWTVDDIKAASARLSLDSHGPGPFRYQAHVDYILHEGNLTISLSVTNEAELTLPFGLGLHPWLPRTPGTKLRAAANQIWLENEQHLPSGFLSVSERPTWDFSTLAELPRDWINNGFAGWDGDAVIVWDDRAVQLAIRADAPLSTYLLYSPSAVADFFCFEPVTHLVDAHNLRGESLGNGLVPLEMSQSVRVSCLFAPSTRVPSA